MEVKLSGLKRIEGLEMSVYIKKINDIAEEYKESFGEALDASLKTLQARFIILKPTKEDIVLDTTIKINGIDL